MSIRKFFSRTANAKQHRRKSEVEARRRLLRTRLLGHETLEDRRLLAVYSNPAAITINDAATASPYPAMINVTTPSVSASVVDVNATITGYSHTSAEDVGILLSGPTNHVELMRRAGGIFGIATNLTYTFSDGSAALNDGTPPSASGTYSPSQYGSAFAYAAPAPAGPFGTTMSEFDGIDPTGTWSLYVQDFIGIDSGTIAGGWSLDIQLGGNVVIDAGADANDGAADTFLVEAVGANTRVWANGINVFDEPSAGITSLTFAGSGDDDTLTVDYAGGNPIPAGGINFDGAGQLSGDTLIVNGGAFTTITSNYTNASDGNVDLDGSVITYTGLEPVLLNVGSVTDAIFNLPAGGNPDVVLADDSAANFPGNGLNAANTSAINATTFEYTSFTNPTSSLTVNLGGGGDMMAVNAMDATYAASLIINGGAGLDELQLTGVTLDTANAGRGLEVNAVEILGITDSTIQNNTVAGAGAGILLTGPSTATIDNSIIADNTATGFSVGGGISNDGVDLTIQNGSLISGNEANNGGGIQNVNGGTVVLDASTVQLNRSNSNGGGVRSLSGSFTVQNGALIDQNTAQTTGGGMSIVGGVLTITDSTVSANESLSDAAGGIFINTTATGVISSSDITDNAASTRGGGVLSFGDLTIDSGTFITGNTAGTDGGGLYLRGGPVDITDTWIDNNTASGAAGTNGGGGVFNDGLTLALDGTVTISNNSADGAAGSGGGIFNSTGGVLNLTGTIIMGNDANRAGGGIEDNSGAGLGVTLTNVTLDNNNALSGPGNGGGLHVSNGGSVLIDGGSVSGNTAAAEGGGLWNSTGMMTVQNGTLIDGNTASGAAADQGGGGIFNNGGTLVVTGAATMIINNIADGAAGSGGGIFNDVGGSVSVTDATIDGNDAQRAGGGIEDNSGAGLGVTLTGVTLDNNNALSGPGNGGGLHVSNGGSVLIDGGSVSGNMAAEEGGGLWNSSGVMTITGGAVIANNTALGTLFNQGGGGIFNAGGTLDIDGVTIDLNTANSSPAAGGGILSDGGTTNVINSNVTNNDEYGIRIINGSGTILNNVFTGNVTADLVVDGTNAAETFNIDATTVQFGANVVTYDGTVPDLDVRGLDGDDIFNVSPSVDTQIFIDGGNPVAPANPGDTLNLMLQNEANVYSDKAVPPNISITTSVAGMPTQPVTFVSIESFLATPGPGSQTVNFIGDNNNTVDQTDNLVIVGRDVDSGAPPIPGAQPEFQPDADGDNEFTFSFNGSPAVHADGTPAYGFRNVAFLNYNSGNLVDTLEITPYADDRPQGWDIDVFYNEGAPAGADGDQVDLLIYHTSAFGGSVSENITVKPSGPDNGELVVTNASDGSLIVDINYVNNTDIIIDDNDGFLNDTDTLTLLGTDGSTPQTSGDETFVVDFTAAGTLGNNIVNVTDTVSGLLLYGIRDINNIDVVNFDLLDGNDNITILGRFGGGVGGDINIDTVNVYGGAGNDTLTLDNTNGLSDMPGGITYDGGSGQDQLMLIGPTVVDSSTYDIGPTADAGTVTHVLGAATQVVHFTGLEPVVDLVPSATLTINANAAANAITYSQSELNPAWGKVSVDGFEPIHFANKTSLVINAAGGGDSIRLNNATLPAGLTGITVNGGVSSSDSVEIIGTTTDDVFTYTPSAVDGGVITQAGSIALTYTLNGIDSLALNAAAQAATDALTVTTANATITPGTDPGTGVVAPVTAGGAPLLGLAYHGVENATVSGTTVVIQGTAEDDTITVSAAGIVSVTNELGFTNSVDVSAFSNVVINALGGDDAITIEPSALAISIIGGDNGDGSDTLTFNGTGGDVTLDLAAQTVTEAGFGAVSYSGIEHLNVNTGAGALLVNGTAGNDAIEVTPNAGGGVLQANGGAPEIIFTATGAVTVEPLGGNDTVVVHGDAAANTFAVSDAAVTVDALKTINLTTGNLEALEVRGGAGGDTFNVVQSATVAISVLGGNPIGLTGDTLNLTPTGAVVFAPGADSDAGGFTAAGGAAVSFDEIEALSVALAGAGGAATIRGTGDDDHITATGTAANTVDVQVNDGPIVTYTGATDISLQALNGDDDIVIDAATASGVAFAVAGGSSTAGSDTLTVLSVAGQDHLSVTPTAQGAGTVVHSGAAGDVVYTAIENIELVGQLADSDSFVIVGTTGEDLFEYHSNYQVDTGSIRGTMDIGGVPFALPRIDFSGMNPLEKRVLGSAVPGESDNVLFFGLDTDDEVAYDGAGLLTNSFDGNLINMIELGASVEDLVLAGLNGSDSFEITPDAVVGILVQGGNPGAGSDTLAFNGTGGDVTLDLAARTILELGRQAVSYSGIETIDLDAGGAVPTIAATEQDDDITVTVWDANSGTLEHGYTMNRLGQPMNAPILPVVNYTNTNGNAVNVDLAGGEDTLNVVGNALAQTFDVNVATSTVAIDDGPNGLGNDGTVTYTNAESLGVFGLEGDDTFNVTAGAIPVFIDGGDPIGQTAGDQLNVIAGGGGVVFEVGPENDEGGILVGGDARMSFDHIESAAVAGAACALIIGTNGDDDITVIARDASTHAGADGVQDFTVSLNAGPAILFLDTPLLHIDASGGDDDIVLRTPAPNDAAWDVDVFIAGGAPSDGAPHAGDRLVLETPGQDNIVYTPTGSDTGTILIDEDGNGVDSGVDSLITIGGFSVACPGLNYTSDPGGIELFEYDGEGANDSLTIVSPAGDDTITHRPGAVMDEGSLRVNTTLAINYQNLGAAGVLTVADTGGTDTLVVTGTASDDVFDVAATTGAVTLITPSATHLTLNQTQVENLTLDGLDGNDDFVINQSQPYENIDVFAGGPSGSDVLTVFGAAGTDETFAVTPGFDRGEGAVTVTGGGVVAIGYVGVEHVLLRANGGDLDNLIVSDDAADNVWTVDAGPIHGDRIQIDDRESIDFDGFNDVTLDNGFGTDRFDIHPTNLVGFGGAFTVNGGGTLDDVLNIIGTPADDVVTSTATVITTNGVGITAGTNLVEVRVLTLAGDDNITLSLALAGVRKVVDGGAGDDVIDVSTMLDATIFGGDGDDHIIGSPFADLIYGGSGNDTIFGLGGNDTIYGGEGNDTIIGGTGNDNLFGGAGSDTFIWDNGDNDDIVEGGAGVDVQIVNGAAAGDDFALSAIQSGRVLFERTNLVPFSISTGGVEQFNVNGLGGGDTFAVNDLTQTDVQVVNLDLGTAADTDAVTIEGRTTADVLRVTNTAGDLAVQGLRYDINILQSSLADGDTLQINGNEGNDSIDVAAGVQNVSVTTINGGAGDDLLTGWFHIANGGDGDDFIRGAANDQTINGGAGEDTMVGGAGADIFDGGPGFDTILVEGFSSNDRIDVRQVDPTTLRHEVGNTDNGFDGVLGGAGTETDTLVIGTVEQVRIVAGAGDDIIRVAHADALVAAGNPAHMLRFDVDGGSPGASDRLTVTDDGRGDTTIQRIGQNDGEGSFTMYALSGGATIALPPVLYTNIEYATLDPIGPVTGGTGTDGNGRLFVFKHDPYEQNQSLPTATFLGANSAYNLDPTIDPGWDVDFNTPGDEDWYRVVAETTGTLDFQVYFRQQGPLANGRAGLPGDGNLEIAVYDADGLVGGVPMAIAGTGAFGSNDANDNERVRIPAVAGQTYYLRVVGAAVAVGDNPNSSPAINVYNVSVLNTAPPVPYDIELNDIVQVGTVNNAIAPSTTNFRAGIAPVNGVLVPTDFDYVGKTVEFTAGPNVGRSATITAFNSGTGQFTVGAGLIAAPTVGDTFIIETTDTGRSQLDDRTRDNTPIITFRLDDNIYRNDLPGNPAGGNAPDELIPIPFNPSQAAATVAGAGFRVPIFIEGAPQQPGTNPQTPIGYARQVAGAPGVYTFDFGDDAIGGPLMLSDGSHFIRAAVEMIDPSSPTQYGFGARSVSLEIVVDTKSPLVSFGDPAIVGDGLHPDSDSGDPLMPATLSDGITNDLTPTFFGRAEANANVKLYLDLDGSGTINGPDILIGQTTAMPFDGTNQEPFAPWEITSTVNFNDPSLGLGIDGVRTILVQAEDVEGNRSADDLALRLDIFIDTRGPQVTDVFVTGREDFDLFALKPETPEPTPRVDSITIRVQDLPNRIAGFLYPAISNLPVAPNVLPLGLISLVGDHSGAIAMQRVLFTPDPFPFPIPPGGVPATGTITLEFAEPLPDDRFTLTLDDGIIDPVGNALDGESNASEPGTPLFPSGDGIPGGDFVARFTVDSRPEVGTWSQGLIYVDINGNHIFDPEGQDNDATNRDFVYQFGRISDGLFAGNFASRGADASGFDKMGAYGLFNGKYSFLLDTDDDGVGDVAQADGVVQVNGIAVAGNFNGDAADGDEVAVFDGSTWYVYDIVGTGMVLIDTITASYNGIPFAGDFNGDGNDDFAVYQNNTNTVIFDTNRDGFSNGELVLGDSTGRFSGLSGFTDKPVAGDLNLDGVDDIGIWVKGRQGVLPKDQGEFFFWVSDVDKDANGVFVPDANPLANFTADVNFPAGAVPLGTTTFSPAPLGNDLFIQWGDEFALPIFGNFDPPVGSDIDHDFGTATNLVNPYDVNNDGRVTALDALILINKLNDGVTEAEPASLLRLRATVGDLFIDVNGDSKLTAVDALQVINELNRIDAASEPIKTEATAGEGDVAWHEAVDSVFAKQDDEDETDAAVDEFLGLMF